MDKHPVCYTYLFASEQDRLPVGYFRKLKKKYIRAVLRDLRHTAHHIYVLLTKLPNSHFAIIRQEGYRHKIGESKAWDGDEFFSVSQFLNFIGEYHPKDVFHIRFLDKVWIYEQQFTPANVGMVYLRCLKSIYESEVRKNKPITLTHQMIREHRLTCADVKTIRILIEQFNTKAIEKVQSEYDLLANLDCIKKAGHGEAE